MMIIISSEVKGEPVMRYDAEHKRKTREKVLDAAAEAIRLEGPHKVGVAGIMAKAGLTHGGFYAHFQSKDDLVACAIGHMFDTSAQRRLDSYNGRPPGEALGAYIDFYLSEGHRDARTTGCVMPALAADLPRLTPAAQQSFAAGVQRLTGRIAALIAGTGQANADDLASSMIAEMVGALSLARAEPDRARSNLMLERSRRVLKQRLNLE
jgi:TetR/AcrR family transcriptional repressor of nem operon